MATARGNHGRFAKRQCSEDELAGEDTEPMRPKKFSKEYEEEQDRLAKENHEAFEICTAYEELDIPTDQKEREIYVRRREQDRCPKCGCGLDYYQACDFLLSVDGFRHDEVGYCNKCRVQWYINDWPPEMRYKKWYRPRDEEQGRLFDKRIAASQCPKCGVRLHNQLSTDARLKDSGEAYPDHGACHICRVKWSLTEPDPTKRGNRCQ